MAQIRKTFAIVITDPRDGGATKAYTRANYNLVEIENTDDNTKRSYIELVLGGQFQSGAERTMEYSDILFFDKRPFSGVNV